MKVLKTLQSKVLMQVHWSTTQDLHMENAQKMHPRAKLLDVQDVCKSSELVDIKVHIDSQVSKPGCNILTSKTSPGYQNDNKPGLGLEIKNNRCNQMVHASDSHKKQGEYIDSQVNKPGCNTLALETFSGCCDHNKSGFVCESQKTKIAMQLHKFWPRHAN